MIQLHVDVWCNCLVTSIGASQPTRQVLSAMLFEISPGDPWALTLAISLLAFVAAFASWIPARRAAHIDPAMSLRE